MTDVALRFELRQHRPHRGVAGWIAEPFTDVLGRGVFADGEQHIHDFPFPS
jgi:hypothetical protein